MRQIVHFKLISMFLPLSIWLNSKNIANKTISPQLQSQSQTQTQSQSHSNQKIYAQSSYHHHPIQSPPSHNSDHSFNQQNHEVKAPKAKPDRIYTSAADRNYHYQAQHHQQQSQPHHPLEPVAYEKVHKYHPQQQQYNHMPAAAMSNDGNALVVLTSTKPPRQTIGAMLHSNEPYNTIPNDCIVRFVHV